MTQSKHLSQLVSRIETRKASVGIIGLGYVGLPLAIVFAEAGYRVLGIDVDERKVDAIERGESYVEDIPSELIRRMVAEGRLVATTDFAWLAQCDAVSICVPTPLNKT